MKKEPSQISQCLPFLGILVLMLIFCLGMYLFLSGKNQLWGNVISLTALVCLIAFIFRFFVYPKKK